MTITIEPYTINSNIENSNIPITYWGIYLDDKKISTTSTKEQAEKTKRNCWPRKKSWSASDILTMY
jgi:hypothetical protein